MPRVIASIRRALGRDRVRVVTECRRCGRTVDDATEACPACGSTSIARYEIR